MIKTIKKIGQRCSIIFFAVLLSACSYNGQATEKAEFIKLFELQEYKEGIILNEVFNNYEGAPYEGVALHEVLIDAQSNLSLPVEEWNCLPLSEDAAQFIESLSEFVSIPTIESGKYRMINRSKDFGKFTNVSLFIFDEEADKGYYIKFDM